MESFSVPLHSGSFGGPQMERALCHWTIYHNKCRDVLCIIQGENDAAQNGRGALRRKAEWHNCRWARLPTCSTCCYSRFWRAFPWGSALTSQQSSARRRAVSLHLWAMSSESQFPSVELISKEWFWKMWPASFLFKHRHQKEACTPLVLQSLDCHQCETSPSGSHWKPSSPRAVSGQCLTRLLLSLQPVCGSWIFVQSLHCLASNLH